MLPSTWNVGYYITKVVFELYEYVVYRCDYSHLRGRLLEYKCELNVQHAHCQISQNMEQWMSYTMILYNMKVEKFNVGYNSWSEYIYCWLDLFDHPSQIYDIHRRTFFQKSYVVLLVLKYLYWKYHWLWFRINIYF